MTVATMSENDEGLVPAHAVQSAVAVITKLFPQLPPVVRESIDAIIWHVLLIVDHVWDSAIDMDGRDG